MIVLSLLGASCSSEEPVPIDFSGSDSTTTTVEANPHSESESAGSGGDANAGQRALVLGLAEQQCLDDPALETGVVQIAIPDTGEVVSEVQADCVEVRTREADGEPVGDAIIPQELRPEE